MRPVQIVETVTADSMAELRAARDRVTDADLVELRLDGVRDLDVAGAVAGRTRPVVVTCRPTWEGGRFDGGEDDRLRLLGEAIRLGVEYVDVEWRADRRALPKSDRTAVVLSHHDLDDVPRDLADRVRAMRAEHDGLLKIAVTAQCLADCVTLRDAVRGDEACVRIAMGPAGQLTRVWPAWVGSCWTYGGSAAPGQMAVGDLARTFRVRDTTPATTCYGIIGKPLGHSASPAMLNAAFAEAGLDAVYVPLETADARDVLAVADAIGLHGASVTAPLKTALAEMDTLNIAGDLPRRLGAVNTIRRGPRGWEAENFDVAGFLGPLGGWLAHAREPRAVVMGAGGAARSVVWALKSQGVQVAIAARQNSHAGLLAEQLQVGTVPWPPQPGWDLLVNCTPVGTWPAVHESPIDQALVKGRLVYDLVYNPAETTLLRWAREAGAETIGGLDMLIHQACLQFLWWTGREAPAGVIARAARAFVNDTTMRSEGHR
jgi:3-dehydroquinate dehydratase/shikimate dehydrogenase